MVKYGLDKSSKNNRFILKEMEVYDWDNIDSEGNPLIISNSINKWLQLFLTISSFRVEMKNVVLFYTVYFLLILLFIGNT